MDFLSKLMLFGVKYGIIINKMSVKNYSPLRYPGGKAKLLPFMKNTIKLNFKKCDDVIYIEPYAGGAAIALGLLLDGVVTDVYINDADPAIYCFWDDVLRHSKKFINKIYDTEITVTEWEKQSKIYHENKHGNAKQKFELGFATFFLNRCNHSGVLKGGIIGGKKQNGKYTIDCRFNKNELVKKITQISAMSKHIHLSCEDAAKWLQSDTVAQLLSKKSLFYLDPPYYIKGRQLYKNAYTHTDHKHISQIVRKTKGFWIVSYDDVPEIRGLYKWVHVNNILDLNLLYSLSHTNKSGNEVMFISNKLRKIPNSIFDD